jgi:uncharacterized protein
MTNLYTTKHDKVAIIGSGISGLASAYLLRNKCNITLFEANGYLGGHTNTVDIEVNGVRDSVDTGFLVYNEKTYPNLIRLFTELGVQTTSSDMSFCVSTPEIQWAGTNLNTVFGDRKNLFSPRYYKFLSEIIAFNKKAPLDLAADQLFSIGIGDYLKQYSADLAAWYLLPMAECIWSTPRSKILNFPAATFVQFCVNHGLLQVNDRPQWRTVTGGARNYVQKIAPHIHNIRLNTPVLSVSRNNNKINIKTAQGFETFDAVILATHAPTSLQLLEQPTELEKDFLNRVPYESNRAFLHLDTRLLPTNKRLYSAWNFVSQSPESKVSLTYLLNKLQPLNTKQPVMVTLNPETEIAKDKVLKVFEYEHPVFNESPRSLAQIQGINRTWFCGAWNGYGFHEDGLRSAIRVVKDFGITPDWGDFPGDFG